tara:strand:- start:2209 stop:3138 length:930 start_codon:yes stop_codon:yes gene_type:complete
MLNSRIKLRHLQAFLEVAKRRSFARAADSLAITQPGVSKVIRELEDILDTSLFERSPKGVALTQAGLTLLRYAGPALRALEEGFGAVEEAHQREHWLRVGVLSTVESQLLPQVLCRWHADDATFSDVSINVVTGSSAFLLSRLHRGELDVVVGRMTEAREIKDLAFEHLYYERLLLVARGKHPLARATTLSPRDLVHYPWILPPLQTTLRQQVDSFYVRHSLSLPSQLLETLSLSISRGYMLRSNAVWVAPEDAVKEALASGEAVELALSLELHGGSVGLCRNASLQSSLALDAFCETVRETGEELKRP